MVRVLSYGEAELLRGRARRMLVSVGNSLSVGDYDIAAFIAEQALQPFLKSAVFKLTGELSHTVDLRELLSVVGS